MDHLLLVSGFGRCGSSLVMQMLSAGGIPVAGEFPAFEDERAAMGQIDTAWLAAQKGRGVKILDPHLPEIASHLPRGIPCKTIFLTRNHKQQAKSNAQFMRLLEGRSTDRRYVRAVATGYRKDEPKALRVLNALGPMMRLRFEALINEPRRAAERIAHFLKAGQVEAMAAAVLPRSALCSDNMWPEALLVERAVSVEQTTYQRMVGRTSDDRDMTGTRDD